MTCARTAEFLGDRNAEKTHLGEAFPQFAVVGLLALEHDAHRFWRAFLTEEFPGLITQLLLVVGEIEVHDLTS